MKVQGSPNPRLPIYLTSGIFRVYMREYSKLVDKRKYPAIEHTLWERIRKLTYNDDNCGWCIDAKTIDETANYHFVLHGPGDYEWISYARATREAILGFVNSPDALLYGCEMECFIEYIIARECVDQAPVYHPTSKEIASKATLRDALSVSRDFDCNDIFYGPNFTHASSVTKDDENMKLEMNNSYMKTIVSDWIPMNETKATNSMYNWGDTSNACMRSPLEGCSYTVKPDNITIKIKEDNTNMAVSTNASKAFNFDFGVVTGDFIRLSPYGLAVRTADGKYVAWDAKTHSSMNVDVLNFKSDGLIFKMPVAIKAVRVGDVVIHNGYPCYVVEVHESTLKVVDISECAEKEICPVKSPFGFNFITKVMTPVNFNSASADNPFGNLGMMMMFANDGNIDPMMLMLMSGQMGMDCSNDPMMTYAMLSMLDNKSDNSGIDLKTMMMTKFFETNSSSVGYIGCTGQVGPTGPIGSY